MLEFMRSKAASWVARVLAVFLIASFAVWGIGDVVRGPRASADVAEVGHLQISGRELSEEFRRTLNDLRTRLGADIDNQTARGMGILDQTLDSLVRNRLLKLEAEWLGLDAGDDLILKTIHSEPMFQNSARQFDSLRFRDWMDRRSMSEQEFVEQLRDQIMNQQILGAIKAGSAAPKALAKTLYMFESEKRSAEFVVVPLPPVSGIADPGPAALAEFHKKNAAQFTAPEYRRLTVVHLSPESTAAEVKPTEERLRTEYEDRLATLSVPERRELQQIVVQDEALARRAFDALKQGRDFTAVATGIAKLATNALSLGLLRHIDLPAKLADAAFGLAVDGISEPVKSPLGWHILRVVKIQEGSTPSFEDMRKKIHEQVARDMAVDALVGLANKLEDALAGGAGIEAAGAQVNARVVRVSGVDRAGLDNSGKLVKNIPRDQNFLMTAFETPMGEASALSETADGGFFLVRVDGVIPPTLKPLDMVRNQAVKAWKESRRNKVSGEKAKNIKNRARGGSLAAAAKFYGLKTQSSPLMRRVTVDEKSVLPQAAIPALFGLKPGATAIAATGKGYVVVELKKIWKADPAAAPERLKELNAQMNAAMTSELDGYFTENLRLRFPVTINRRALDALF